MFDVFINEYNCLVIELSNSFFSKVNQNRFPKSFELLSLTSDDISRIKICQQLHFKVILLKYNSGCRLPVYMLFIVNRKQRKLPRTLTVCKEIEKIEEIVHTFKMPFRLIQEMTVSIAGKDSGKHISDGSKEYCVLCKQNMKDLFTRKWKFFILVNLLNSDSTFTVREDT